MGGTREGSLKAVQTIKEKHGESFYKQIGSKGCKAPTTKPKGYAAMPREQVVAAGKLGGSIGGKMTQARRKEIRLRAQLEQGSTGSKLSPETLELLQLQRMQMEANR